MEKVNGFYVYNPQKEDEEQKKKQQKEQKNEYLEALKKNNRIPTQEEKYYAELQQEAELQKTLNGETKDLPEIGFFEKLWWTAVDLDQQHFSRGWGKSFEGMIDTVIDLGGFVGSLFGASDQWAKDAREFDIHEWVMNNLAPVQESPLDWGTPGNQRYEFIKEHPEYSWLNDGKGGQVIGDIAEGVGGILPSILIGGLVGGIAKGAGASASAVSTATKIGSTVSFGMGATGNATQQALDEGASYDEAKVYGLASGLMETGIEMISGGIGGVGTGVAQKVFPKLTRNAVVKFVSSAVGEGVEEMASEMITPYLKRVTYNENAPTATTEQVLEAGLIGALVGSVMQGGQIAVTPKGVRIGNNIQELVEVQNQYYENGQFAKAEAISKKIQLLQEQFATELEKASVDVESMKLSTNSQALNKLDEKMSKEVLEDGATSKYQQARDRIQQEYDTVLENMDSEKRSNYIIEKGISYKYDIDTGKVNDKWNTYSKEQQQSLKDATDFVNKVNKRMDSKFKIVFNHDVKADTDINSVLYDGDTILVNANADINQVKQSVAKHEVTHALENTKNYKTIKDIVLSIEKKNKDYERKIQQIRSKYAENSNLKDAFNKMSAEEQNTYLEQELVAEYVRENLFTSEESINKLAKEHTSIAKRILNFIKEKINSLKQDKEAKETSKLLKKAEDLYIKALEEFDKTQVEKAVEKYSLKETTAPRAVENKKKEGTSTQTLKKEADKSHLYIKAYADLNARKVFTKKEIRDGINMILDDIKANGAPSVKNGVDLLNKLLFEKLNTIKANTNSDKRYAIFKEVATTIVDYVEASNGFTYNKDDKDVAIDLTVIEMEVLYNNNGKIAKFVKFKEYYKNRVETLKNEKREIRDINKEIHKAIYKAKRIKEINTKKYADHLGGAVINKKIEAISKIIGKISVRDFLSTKTRLHVAEYGRAFYNSEMASKEGYELNAEVLKDISLFEKNLDSKKALSLEEVKALNRILADAIFKIQKGDNIKIGGEEISVPEASITAIESVRQTKFKDTMIKKYINSSVNPRVVIRALENYNDGVLTKIFQDIQKSETEYYRQYMDFYEPFNAYENKHKKYMRSLKNEKVVINGKEFKKGEAISLLLLSKREQAKPHLFEGGITFKDKKTNKMKHYSINQTDIDLIAKQLTKEDEDLIKIVEDFFNNKAKEVKEKTDYKLLGYTNIKNESYYFPIVVDSGSRFQTIGEPDSDISSVSSVFSYSFNNDIVEGARNEIVLSDVMTVVEKHARQLSMYSSMTETVQNLCSIWNRKVEINGKKTTFKKELSLVWADGYKYIDNLIKDMEGTQLRDSTDKIISKIRANYTVFQLGFNLKTIVKQLGAIPNSLLYLDGDSILKGKYTKELEAEMDEYCPYVKFRNFDNDYIKSQLLFEEGINKAQKVLMSGISYVDRFICVLQWQSCKYQVSKDYNLDINSPECKHKAGELLEKIIRETQSNSTSDKSSLVRNKNELVKGFMQFMSNPTQNLSVIVETTGEYNHRLKEYKNNKTAENKAKLKTVKTKMVKAYSSVIMGLALTSFIDKLFDKLRGKEDDDEEGLLAVIKDIGYEVSSLFPFIRDIYGKLVYGYDIEHYAIAQMDNLFSISEWYNSGSAYGRKKIAYAFGEVIGFPVRNIDNVFDIFVRYEDDSFNDLSAQKEDITKYLNRNRLDKASQVVDDIFTSRGLVDTPKSITNKYANFSKSNVFLYPKALDNKITINGVEYQLSDEEYSLLQKEYNKAHVVATKAINYKDFSNLSSASQAKALNKIYEAYYYQALDNVLEVEDLSNKKLAILNDAIPMYKLVTHYYKIKELQLNKTNKKDIAKNYINKLPMSRVQKELMMVYLGYSVSNTNIIPTIKNYLTSKGIVGEERDYILSLC